MRELKHIFRALIFVKTITLGFSQTFAIEDTNLIQKLRNDYPSTINDANELVIEEAKNITGILNLSSSNISNVSGIEHFTGVSTIFLSDNNLTSVPSLSNTMLLRNFYASDNQLTNLPSFNQNINLKDFQVMNNELNSLPDLSNCNLLERLYCSENNLSSIPNLEYFPKLTHLVIGDNPLENNIDYSKCPLIKELHIHQLGIDTVIGLEILNNLEVLYAWGNEISDLSSLDSLENLETCVIYRNLLHDLPYFGNKPNINLLVVNSNYLDFDDLKKIDSELPQSFIYTYSPQKNFKINNQTIRLYQSLEIVSPKLGHSYVWKKDSLLVDSSGYGKLSIEEVTLLDKGFYTLSLSHDSFPDLNLKSDVFVINIDSCMDFKVNSFTIVESDCKEGYTLDLSPINIGGGTLPFKYLISNSNFSKNIDDLNKVVTNIPEGNFMFSVEDSKNCKLSYNLLLDKISNCDPVITPNGDGESDYYLFESSNEITIYDYQRNLITSFKGPQLWDGTDNSGNYLDSGYYIVIDGDLDPIQITVIR